MVSLRGLALDDIARIGWQKLLLEVAVAVSFFLGPRERVPPVLRRLAGVVERRPACRSPS
jgi:hypothetical protein